METQQKPMTDAERFRAFAQQIVSVPKTEIDRRAKAYQKTRKALRKAKA